MSTVSGVILAVTVVAMFVAIEYFGVDLLGAVIIFFIGLVLYGAYHFKYER